MNLTEAGVYTYNGETKEYKYATDATISEQIVFVEAVTDSVFVNGNYIALLKDAAFRYMFVSVFTDIDVSELGAIDDFDDFDKQTGISKKIMDDFRPSMLDALRGSVDANIEYKKSIAHDNVSTAIVDLINTVKNKLEAFGEGLNADMVMDFIQKFGEAGIDSESIANAYLNSDGFKKNVADLTDAKNAEIRDLKQELNKVTARNVMADKSDKVIPIKGE